ALPRDDPPWRRDRRSPRSVFANDRAHDDQPGRHAALADGIGVRAWLRDDGSRGRERIGSGRCVRLVRGVQLDVPSRSRIAPRDLLHGAGRAHYDGYWTKISDARVSGARTVAMTKGVWTRSSAAIGAVALTAMLALAQAPDGAFVYEGARLIIGDA